MRQPVDTNVLAGLEEIEIEFWMYNYIQAIRHFIPHVYGSLWRWKHWSVRQIKPAQLAFGRTL